MHALVVEEIGTVYTLCIIVYRMYRVWMNKSISNVRGWEGAEKKSKLGLT